MLRLTVWKTLANANSFALLYQAVGPECQTAKAESASLFVQHPIASFSALLSPCVPVLLYETHGTKPLLFLLDRLRIGFTPVSSLG